MLPINSEFRAQLAREKIVELQINIKFLQQLSTDNIRQQIWKDLLTKTFESDLSRLERHLEGWENQQGEGV